jgi:hypothetical protein
MASGDMTSNFSRALIAGCRRWGGGAAEARQAAGVET